MRARAWMQYADMGGRVFATHYTFTTPVGTPADRQCGKVLYSDFHVEDSSSAGPRQRYPGQCTNTPMTPQLKALEFMVFDLASCVQPDDQPPVMPRVIL